jgi:hypothetical protein
MGDEQIFGQQVKERASIRFALKSVAWAVKARSLGFWKPNAAIAWLQNLLILKYMQPAEPGTVMGGWQLRQSIRKWHFRFLLVEYEDDCLLGCSLVEVYRRFRGAFCLHFRPDHGDCKHVWNIFKLLPDYTAQHLKRQSSSQWWNFGFFTSWANISFSRTLFHEVIYLMRIYTSVLCLPFKAQCLFQWNFHFKPHY